MNKSSLLQRVSARGCHSKFRSVRVYFVAHARRFTGLRIDDSNIRNIDPGFLVDDAAAAISGGFLVTLDHADRFDFHLAAPGGNRQHTATLSFVAPGDQHYLIVL